MSAPHSPQRRSLAGLAMGALGAAGVIAAAAGLCAESIRVPDQP
jgi:hypothetical protein